MSNSTMQSSQRIVVTGIGICSPGCRDIEQFSNLLREGGTGIEEHKDIFEDRSVWAGIVKDHSPEKHFTPDEIESFDRTAQMGFIAAQQAILDSRIRTESHADRIALTLGTSHGGRSQFDHYVLNNSTPDTHDAPRRLLVTAAHYQQTSAVARKLRVHGPTATLSNACSSSGAAIAYGIELLRSGKCDYAITGGADGFSRLTLSGFTALGAVADGPCAPFSEPIGLSLGDGAGFLAIETLDHAEARGAKIYAELWGYGLSWDAYHITAPEPSGEGMNRAIRMAVNASGIQSDHIDYVNVHGTGTRSNDLAETVGLQRFFENNPPPISATKSQTGHMLGASSAVGIISCIVGLNEQWLPPTSNFTSARGGCEIDVIPNTSRSTDWSCFMAQSAAFAGANAVVVGGKLRDDRQPLEMASDDIVITGVGVVSPLGFSLEEFGAAIEKGKSGIQPITEFDVTACGCKEAGMVRNFKPRKLMPSISLRRVDRVAAYATISASLALQHSANWPLVSADRTGLVVGVCRGAATSYEKYLASVEGSRWEKASAVHFPNLVMSSVGGQVSASLGIKGITSSLVGGTAAGLQALIHASELFRRNAQQDACVVLASDELAAFYFKLFDRMGRLASGGNGMQLGEGSVAFTLERAAAARARGANILATLRGSGLTYGSTEISDSQWLARAYELAAEEAGIQLDAIDQVYGSQQSCEEHDLRELAALKTALGRDVTPDCINHLTGVAEASSSLFNLAAAIACRTDRTRTTLLSATGDDGSNAAAIFEI